MSLPVLIPVYNGTRTLAETLASLAVQELLPSRVILADDASTDGTIEFAKAHWTHESVPLEIWPAEQNGGERKTVNRAFQRLHAANEPWVAVLHADDVAKPHWLRLMVEATRQYPDSASICASWDDWFADGSILPGEDNLEREPEVVAGTVASASGTLKRGCWWHFSGCVMNMPAFHAVGGFDEAMPQLGDIEWLVRCLIGGHHITYLPRTLIRYRNHPGTVSDVSFRTNRDLREAWRIHEQWQHHAGMTDGLQAQARNRCRQSLRRAVTSLLRGRFGVAWEAAHYACRFGAARFEKS